MKTSLHLVIVAALCAGCEAQPGPHSSRAAPLCESTLSEVTKVGVDEPRALDQRFGAAVAAAGSQFAIAAPGADWVWTYSCDEFSCLPTQRVTGAALRSFERFGTHVALGEDLLAIATDLDEGRVDVFRQDADGRWSLVDTIVNLGPDEWVTAVALDGPSLAIGRSNADGNGAVDVYTVEPAAVVPRTRLTGTVGFGSSLAFVDGDLFVGAVGDDTAPGVVTRYDPSLTEVAALSEPALENDARFGASIAVNDTRVFVGAPGSNSVAPDGGYVAIFDRVSETVAGSILPERTEAGLQFGASLAADNGYVAVGAPGSDEFVPDGGAVSVFDATNLALVNRPDVLGMPMTTGLGRALAFHDGNVLAGVAGNDRDGEDVGVVELFKRDSDEDGTVDFAPTWTLPNPDSLSGAGVGGSSISADADRLAAGAATFSGNGDMSGAAFTYSRGADGWQIEATLIPADARFGSRAGAEVLLLGSTALVGMPGHASPDPRTGAVAVFELTGDSWTETQTILSPSPAGFARFGASMDGDDDTIVITEGDTNVTHLFARDDFSFRATLTGVGAAVDLAGDLLIAGHDSPDDNFARIYRETSTGDWEEVSELRPPAPIPGFGREVALGDGVAFVYADAATAADAEQFYGAVHVFIDEGDGYQWVRAVESDRPNYKAYFGERLAVNGDYLAATATGDTRDAESTGAVYVIHRDVGGSNYWGIVRRVTQDPPTPWQGYGATVAWHDDALLVGDGAASTETVPSSGGFEVLENATSAPPSAADDEVTIPRDAETVELDVLENDGDPDRDELFVVIDAPPSAGEVSFVSGAQTLAYTPGPQFGGTDSFRYVVSDCQSVSEPATVTLVWEAAACDETVPCPDGEVCVGETCFPGCTTTDDCADGEACFEDRCAVEACDGVICADEEVCYGGSCFAQCTDDGCAEGQCFAGRCADDACSRVVCPATEVCAGGSCFASCTDNDQCSAEQSCFDGRCATDACDAIQCATGEVCIEGSCFEGAQCSFDAECRPGQRCEGGYCTSPPRDGCCRTFGSAMPRRTALLMFCLLAALGFRRRR